MEETPVALYNSDKQELIGVFENTLVAARYLYPYGDTADLNRVGQSLRRKGGICNSELDCRVVVRHASQKQLQLIANALFYIADGYPAPLKGKLSGYTTTVWDKSFSLANEKTKMINETRLDRIAHKIKKHSRTTEGITNDMKLILKISGV